MWNGYKATRNWIIVAELKENHPTEKKPNWHLSQLDVREHYYQLRNLYFLRWNDQKLVADNGLNS